jgi:hypothetical protein
LARSPVSSFGIRIVAACQGFSIRHSAFGFSELFGVAWPKVDVASRRLSRDTGGGLILTALNLDNVPAQEVLREIQNALDIRNVEVVKP